MIKVVVFDINGVIWKNRRFNTLFFDLLAKTLGLHPKTIRSKYLKVHNLFQLGKLDLITWLKKDFKLTIKQLQAFGYQLQDIFQKLYPLSFYPHSLPLIRQLQKKGLTVGCLSNMPNYLVDLFTKAGFFCHFHFKILSSVVGIKKPNQKIYKKIFSIGRWTPEEVLIIDNEINNIAVAKKLGFSTHHFKSYPGLISKLNLTLS